MTKPGLAKCFGDNDDAAVNGETDIPDEFTDGSASVIDAKWGHTCMSKTGLAKCFG